MDCIFCKIVSGEIPANKVYEDEDMVVFHDLNPQAPVHVLQIPKIHFSGLTEAFGENAVIIGKMMGKIPELAKMLALDGGFRVVCNSGADGGQTVNHLHFHLLGGRAMAWPPG